VLCGLPCGVCRQKRGTLPYCEPMFDADRARPVSPGVRVPPHGITLPLRASLICCVGERAIE